MSSTTLDPAEKVKEWQENQYKWATDAVRGANNWLVTIRNATDEGIAPWSDDFVDGRNGMMSMSEGITALALLESHAPTENPRWQRLRTRYYTEDMSAIIDHITGGEEPTFRSDPYMAGLETTHFVPAATFSTSAILESINAGIEFGDDVTDQDLQDALERNVDWLLENRVDGSYDGVETEGGAGWAWIGTESDEYEEKLASYYPRNYFTYSALLVLTDLLANQDQPIVRAAVSSRETEIKTALEEAKTFLINEYWDDGRGAWTYPSGRGRENPDDVLLSNCYAFVGLSYMSYLVDEIDLSETAKHRMASAMEWLIDEAKEAEVWTVTVAYECGGGDNEFVDGSGPYILLDAMLEVVNYRHEIFEEIEHSESEVDDIITKLLENVLEYCWAGDARYEQKGFRHVGNSNSLVEFDDGDPENNPTTIYSTGIAVETLLLNYLSEGDDIVEDDVSVASGRSGDSTAETGETDTEAQTVNHTNKHINIFAGDAGGLDGDGLNEQLQTIQTQVEQLVESVEDGDGERELTAEFTERNRQFIADVREARTGLNETYERQWPEVVDNLAKAKGSLSTIMGGEELNWEHIWLRKNVEEFLEYLEGVYFCPDRETYEDEIRLNDGEETFLLPPQREIYEEIDGWNDEFTDVETRKGDVEEMLESLAAEPWAGQDPVEFASEFNNRYVKENDL